MNFFKRKDKDDQQSVTHESQSANVLQGSVDNGINFIIDNATSSHPRRDTRIMNSTQLQHVKDAKKLAETKLSGLEDSLGRLRAQQQWLRRYNETRMALDREKKHLFELGKQKAMMSKDSSMLERYDLFEGIHGIYQKLAVVKEQIDYDKRGLSILEQETDENRRKVSDQEKRQQNASDTYKNAYANLVDMFDRVCSAYQLTGANEMASSEIVFLLDFNNKIKEEMDALAAHIAEKEASVQSVQSELEQLKVKLQSMEIHENMLRHGEAVIIQLKYMEDRDKRCVELQQKYQSSVKLQNEQNDFLGKAFLQYQDLVSQAEAVESELSMHRSYIQGQDGLMLQERALMLKGRRQMLHSALSLWKRISTGYELIEEKSKKVTALRLNIQHLEDSVRLLDDETGKAQRLCKEKEYTYLISKGQDIIQLRADLKEGVSCSVCGATHHPYHSDTILDQSKLIGEMKTDYEMLTSEANAKNQQLIELRSELAMAQGQLGAEEEGLNALRIRQNEDVLEWKLYAELDPTFVECSESTNLDARTALLRQFIENVTRDAELAEKELETFTFHQSSIAKLGEQLQALEQKKSEVNVRLSELNTGLQVYSREVEQLTVRLENIKKQFLSIYERMQQSVSIKDWYTLWRNAPEQLYEKIQKLISDWQTVHESISNKDNAMKLELVKLEGMKSMHQSLAQAALSIRKQVDNIESQKAENTKSYQQLIPAEDAGTLHQINLRKMTAAQENYEDERSKMDEIRHHNDIMNGRHDYYLSHIARLEGEQKELGEKLDLWMHAFNLQHPPVQISELNEVFADGKDWSKIRSSLKQMNTEMLLCQAKVEDLNSRLIALDTEDGRCNTQATDIQETITSKQQTLTKQRDETMMQIARLSVQIEDHERALSAERNSAETLAIQSRPEINLT